MLEQPSTVTDANGVAIGLLTTTMAEAKVVTATADSLVLTQQATITFVAGPISVSRSSLSVDTHSVLADGTSTATLAVKLVDASGNPASGHTVRFITAPETSIITQPSVPTDASGQAQGLIASTSTGPVTVSALIDDTLLLTPTVQLTFVPGGPSALASFIVAAPRKAVADGLSSISVTATIVDDWGHPLSGKAVVLSSSGAGNWWTQPPGLTGADGKATGTLASTVAGLSLLSATVDGTVTLLSAPQIEFVAGPPSVARSLLEWSGSAVADGLSAVRIKATLIDANNNAVGNVPATIRVTGSGNLLTPVSTTTDLNGVLEATLSSTKAETKTITVSGTAVLQTDVVFNPGAPSAETSTITIPPDPVIADNSAQAHVTVTVRDAQNNPVPGRSVSITASAPGFSPIPAYLGMTDENGVATGGFSFSSVGWMTVTATVDTTLLLTATAQAQFVAGPPTRANLLFTGQVSYLYADGGLTAGGEWLYGITDDYGNPVAGVPVTVSLSGWGNTVTRQPNGVTDVYGRVVISATSVVPEQKTLTVSGAGFTSTDSQYFLAADDAPSITQVSTSGVSGCVTISYTVSQPASGPVDLVVDYAPAGGGSFRPATGVSGTQTTGLTTSAAGVPHTFVWNTTADMANSNGRMTVRVSASHAGLFGLSATTTLTVWDGSVFTLNPTHWTAQIDRNRADLATGDLNNDGWSDIVLFNNSAILQTFLSNPAQQGAFVTGGTTPVNTAQGFPEILVGDVTGDGLGDAVLVYSQPYLMKGVGNGTFLSPNAINLYLSPTAGALGDFDGDGVLDAALAYPSMLVFFRWNGAIMQFATEVDFPQANLQIDKVVAADFNRDGKTDFLVSPTGGPVMVVLNDGNWLRNPQVITVGGPGGQVTVADINADGKLDLVDPSTTGAGGIAFGNGDGTFQAFLPFVPPSQGPIYVADFNLDGYPDFAFSSSADYADVMLGHGDGTFGPSTALYSPSGFTAASQIVVADFDHNGRPDIVVGYGAGGGAGTNGILFEYLNTAPALCGP